MARMRAVDAAVRVLEKEGISVAFGVPGAAINPLYSAMKARQSIRHILARHVEGASHMAEGFTRARAGNIGVCIGTSGPAGTDMITGLYSASADSIPILCITGQAPRARLDKEDFQAVDIESIAAPVTKWSVTVKEPALVPMALQKAFHVMRSGRPGPVLIDLPLDVHHFPFAQADAGGDAAGATKGIRIQHDHRQAIYLTNGRACRVDQNRIAQNCFLDAFPHAAGAVNLGIQCLLHIDLSNKLMVCFPGPIIRFAQQVADALHVSGQLGSVTRQASAVLNNTGYRLPVKMAQLFLVGQVSY